MSNTQVGEKAMAESISIFKTPELEHQYYDAYDAVLALWPVPYESLDVATSFGTTHVNACGDLNKPPIVLFPGFGANSTTWFANVAALTSQFRVYAVDTPGQPGKSIPSKPLLASNCHDWIDELITGLGLERAHLAGVSLGAWLALRFAIWKPERVDHLVLLDPAASIEGLSLSFLFHSFIPVMVKPTRTGLVKYFRWMTQGYQVNKKWGELMILGILNTRPHPPVRATVFNDAELKSIQPPVLLLIGEHSVIYNPQRAYQRATSLIPNIKAEIVPGSSHAIVEQKSELVNTSILEFC
jgi:pimeloyl-ACP methyl ester carboxylesterase